MVVWTAFALWAYAEPRRRGRHPARGRPGRGDGPARHHPPGEGGGLQRQRAGLLDHGRAVRLGDPLPRAGGLAPGLLLAGVDLAVRPEITQTDYGNAFLLVIGGLVVGYMCESLQRMAIERELAERTAAAAAERTRLARVVHDGVLQVLALVQRGATSSAGTDPSWPGWPGSRSASCVALIREEATSGTRARPGPDGRPRRRAGRLERDRRSPWRPRPPPSSCPAGGRRELVAAVRACLDNVATHVGERRPGLGAAAGLPRPGRADGARRGPGIPDGRLDEAAAQGRLGVSESIRGGIGDLGGTATLDTGPLGHRVGVRRPAALTRLGSGP